MHVKLAEGGDREDRTALFFAWGGNTRGRKSVLTPASSGIPGVIPLIVFIWSV